MMSALLLWGFEEGVGARKSRSKMLLPLVGAVGAGAAAAVVGAG